MSETSQPADTRDRSRSLGALERDWVASGRPDASDVGTITVLGRCTYAYTSLHTVADALSCMSRWTCSKMRIFSH